MAKLDAMIDRYSPEIAALARAVLEKLRRRMPGAVELVYDSHNGLVIGFGPSERASDAPFSVGLYPGWINLYFLHGASLRDPRKLLAGKGKQARHIRVDDPSQLDDPAVIALMDAALARCEPIDPSAKPRTIVKAIAPSQRPRR